MKKIIILGFALVLGTATQTLFAQQTAAELHAGIHSGSWTLKRQQILEEESKDPYRSCTDPYCQRCSKHLADYGHEYQYVGGRSTRQPYYGGTAGRIAHVTQRGYDEHSRWYKRPMNQGAVMYPEYQRVLNHAIDEQIWARNAVAAQEAAEDNLAKLGELRDAAALKAQESEGLYHLALQENGDCHVLPTKVAVSAPSRCSWLCNHKSCQSKVYVTQPCCCPVCEAKARMLADKANLEALENGIKAAAEDLDAKKAVAEEAVRIALLSKPDADRATRFMRIQHKPPRYQEVLAAQEAAEAKKAAEDAKKAKDEKGKKAKNSDGKEESDSVKKES